MENVTDVMEKITEDKRKYVWRMVLEWRWSRSDISEIYNGHSTEKEKIRAYSDVYVNCRPESSWEYLTSQLYTAGEMTAVDQARPFLPPRGELTTIIAFIPERSHET